jgi:hypothetical protein
MNSFIISNVTIIFSLVALSLSSLGFVSAPLFAISVNMVLLFWAFFYGDFGMFSIQAVQFEYAQIFILALGVVHTAIGIVQPTTGKRITFSTEFLGVFYVFFFFLNLLLSCRDTFLIILLAEGVTLLTLVMIVVSTSLKSFRTVPSIINYFLINIVLAAILVFAALQMYTITGYTSISAIHYFLSTSNSDCSL